MKEEARAQLRQRGLLDGLPMYDPERETLAVYAARLQAFRGFPGHYALRAVGPHTLEIGERAEIPTFSPESRSTTSSCPAC